MLVCCFVYVLLSGLISLRLQSLSLCLLLFASLVLSFFFFKQKTAYEMRISDWSSDVCSSDLAAGADAHGHRRFRPSQGHRGGMALAPCRAGWATVWPSGARFLEAARRID